MNKQIRGDYGNKPNTIPTTPDVIPYDPNKGGKTDKGYMKMDKPAKKRKK